MTGTDEVTVTLTASDWLEVAYVLVRVDDDPRAASAPELRVAAERALRRIMSAPAVIDHALDLVTRDRFTADGESP